MDAIYNATRAEWRAELRAYGAAYSRMVDMAPERFDAIAEAVAAETWRNGATLTEAVAMLEHHLEQAGTLS